jgi:hypothetical protein
MLVCVEHAVKTLICDRKMDSAPAEQGGVVSLIQSFKSASPFKLDLMNRKLAMD